MAQVNDREKFADVNTRIELEDTVVNNVNCLNVIYHGRLNNAALYLTVSEAIVLRNKLVQHLSELQPF